MTTRSATRCKAADYIFVYHVHGTLRLSAVHAMHLPVLKADTR